MKKTLKNFGAQLENVFAQRLQLEPFPKLPLKKKVSPVPPTQNKSKNTTVSNGPAPPPPPPPPPFGAADSKSNPAVPPPPPPPSMNNNSVSKVKKNPVPNNVTKPNKIVNKVVEPVKKVVPSKTNNQPEPVPPLPASLNPDVDETPITVASQRKLWEAQREQEQQTATLPKVKKTPATPNNVVKAKPVWGQPPTSSLPPPESAADKRVSPNKKIIIKQRATKEDTPEDVGVRRRSTRDLVDAIESVSSANSASPSPYSSPATPRRQMVYGRRSTTQVADHQPVQPAPTRKPMWGLRDQVDTLVSDSPSSTPTRSRSPVSRTSSPAISAARATGNTSLTSTPRESQSPSPSRFGGKQEDGTKKPMVFGRVPPRRTSLTGNGNINVNNSVSNDVSLFELIVFSIRYINIELFFTYFHLGVLETHWLPSIIL